jgi:hypothetical protein
MFGVLFILVGIPGAHGGSIFQTVKNRPRSFLEQQTGRGLDE